MTATAFEELMKRLDSADVNVIAQIVVPRMPVLAVRGDGSPGDQEFRDAVRDLYALAFAVKMLPRTDEAPPGHHEYEMPPMQAIFASAGRSDGWRILFPQPEFVTAAVVAKARVKLAERGAAAGEVAFETLEEGLCVQTLHVGPFADESRTVTRLRDFAKSRGYALSDHHHDIYLDDPQKVAAADMRTVIRYPVRPTD